MLDGTLVALSQNCEVQQIGGSAKRQRCEYSISPRSRPYTSELRQALCAVPSCETNWIRGIRPALSAVPWYETNG